MTTAARHQYAGLVSRSVAYVVDALIVVFGISGGVAVLSVVAMVAGSAARDIAQAAASGYVFFLPAVLAIYCAVFWLLAGRTPGMALVGVRVGRLDGRPVRWLGAFVRGVLLAFLPILALWLSEIVPPTFEGTFPDSLTEAGLRVNPVYVLDLAVLLPSLIVTGAFLMRGRPWGWVLAPVQLVALTLDDDAGARGLAP